MTVLTDEMKHLVRTQRLGFVATVSPDGTPNLSPKGSLTVWDDQRLVFADIESPHTIRNLADHPQLEVNVVDPFTRKGWRFRGRGTVLRSGELYWKVLELYKAEGADVRRIRAVVVIDVLQAAPLVSPVYLTGLTEAEVRRLWEEYHVKSLERTISDLTPPSDF